MKAHLKPRTEQGEGGRSQGSSAVLGQWHLHESDVTAGGQGSRPGRSGPVNRHRAKWREELPVLSARFPSSLYSWTPLKKRVPPENLTEFGEKRKIPAVLVILNLSNGKASFQNKCGVFLGGGRGCG